MITTEGRTTSALLYLDGVHVSFDGFRAINNLSLTLAPGEMRAIIGPNGAGKTTMMDIITGKTRPDEGTVLFDGVTDLTRLDETRIAELAIGRALVMRPKLLLLDEPTEGIQPSIIKDIGRAISYLRNLGNIAIVLVEQYLDFACQLGDYFAVMDRGAVKYSCDRAGLDQAEISRQMAL